MARRRFGHKLNPYRRLREAFGVKATRQNVVIVTDPSRIDQNQPLLVRFDRLGSDDVIVPGTVRLAFNISLTSRDPNRTVVKNLGRAIVKKITNKVEVKEIQSIDDSDIFY